MPRVGSFQSRAPLLSSWFPAVSSESVGLFFSLRFYIWDRRSPFPRENRSARVAPPPPPFPSCLSFFSRMRGCFSLELRLPAGHRLHRAMSMLSSDPSRAGDFSLSNLRSRTYSPHANPSQFPPVTLIVPLRVFHFLALSSRARSKKVLLTVRFFFSRSFSMRPCAFFCVFGCRHSSLPASRYLIAGGSCVGTLTYPPECHRRRDFGSSR